VRFIHKRPLLEPSRIEHHHQTIAGQAFEDQTFADLTALQRSLQAPMLVLNQEYPTRALVDSLPFKPFRRPGIPAASIVSMPKNNFSTCNASTISCKADAGFGRLVRLEHSLLVLWLQCHDTLCRTDPGNHLRWRNSQTDLPA